jgi:hypothetical protein
MTALPSSPIYFGTFQAFNPAAKHGANFAYKRLRGLCLVLGHQLALVVDHEAQHQPQLAKAAIKRVAAAELVDFDGIVEMLSH